MNSIAKIRLEVVDREKVGDRDAIVLASQASPTRIEKLYFDAQTGLLIRFQTITQTPIGAVPVRGKAVPITLFSVKSTLDAAKAAGATTNVPVPDKKLSPEDIVKQSKGGKKK